MAWKASPKQWEVLKPVARKLRGKPTEAEALLWRWLRKANAGGNKFRRQQVLGRFVVDFYCSTAKLVVEVDGRVHESQAAADARRQDWLEHQGLRVLRFSNDAVLKNPQAVVAAIQSALQQT